MRKSLASPFLSMLLLEFLFTRFSAEVQSTLGKQAFDYQGLKGLLATHKSTVSSLMSLKRFKLASSQERPENTIYAYIKEGGTTRLLIRIRKSDGVVREVAWKEDSETLGNLTHDTVYDGFVPVAGNSQYYNRFQGRALFVNYALAEEETIPCRLKLVGDQ